MAKQAKVNGYVTTAFGRKLYIPRNKPYIGANYVIQGTAAGILKRGQNKVYRYLKSEWNNDIKMVLPIHDELIIQYPKKLLRYKDRILKTISQLMTDIPEISIRLDVEWKVTRKSWDEAKEIKVKY